MHIGVLSSENRTESEMVEMEVISGIHEGTEFVAVGVSAGELSLQQRLPMCIVAVAPAVYPGVNVKSLVPISGVQSAATGVHIHVSRVKVRPGMRVCAKASHRNVLGDPVVNANGH